MFNDTVYFCTRKEDSIICRATPTMVLVCRLLMNSTAGHDVPLISMSVMGFSLSVVFKSKSRVLSSIKMTKKGKWRKARAE